MKISSTCLLSPALAPLTSVLYDTRYLRALISVAYVQTRYAGSRNPLSRTEKEARWHAFEHSCKIRIFSRSHFRPQTRATLCQRGSHTWDLGFLKVPGWLLSLALHPPDKNHSIKYDCMRSIRYPNDLLLSLKKCVLYTK